MAKRAESATGGDMIQPPPVLDWRRVSGNETRPVPGKLSLPATLLCEVLGVSTSGYYRWLKRKPSAREVKRNCVLQRILEIFEASGKTYGAPRVYKQLRAEGYRSSKRTVEETFGPRNSVCQRLVPRSAGQARGGSKYESPWQLLGQCCG